MTLHGLRAHRDISRTAQTQALRRLNCLSVPQETTLLLAPHQLRHTTHTSGSSVETDLQVVALPSAPIVEVAEVHACQWRTDVWPY